MVAPAMEDVGYLNVRLCEPVDDHRAALERDGAQAGLAPIRSTPR